jgi:hypothetical protein
MNGTGASSRSTNESGTMGMCTEWYSNGRRSGITESLRGAQVSRPFTVRGEKGQRGGRVAGYVHDGGEESHVRGVDDYPLLQEAGRDESEEIVGGEKVEGER